MEKWIKSIKGTIPHTNKTVDIKLDGKNLIVTGANGSGKTSFVRTAHRILSLLIEGKMIAYFPPSNQQIKDWKNLFDKNKIYFPKGSYSNGFSDAYDTINSLERKIKEIENGIKLEINETEILDSILKLENKQSIIRFFEEKRLSEIKQPKIGQEIEEGIKLGNYLEQYLVNRRFRLSYAKADEKDKKLVDDIENWFTGFENKLKFLFDDDNLEFKFDPDGLRYSIIQEDKPPFSFQTLSAGYRAIFDIYADLLMHTEYFKIMPNELTGVVLIDEIDSHLHVSLQRLILPFFTQSFPKIQFIVTTHSPFVLMSTPDTVVFDLAKNEAITEDLSYYTYSAIMEGLWNVKPISIHLENSIKEISKIVNSEYKDYKRLKELVEATRPYEGALDSESKVFLLLGMETLLEEGGENV